ncbi:MULTISPECIES: hypothetical protein [unclassified Chryseobacterium]|uniref:hypothetical protein n=1 Tax=unclassified Chryseobacterium TaxID=2593645 RepID=UPI0030195335
MKFSNLFWLRFSKWFSTILTYCWFALISLYGYLDDKFWENDRVNLMIVGFSFVIVFLSNIHSVIIDLFIKAELQEDHESTEEIV